MGLGFGDWAGGSRVRAREVLAKLSGGRGEGRCSSLQTRGSQPDAQPGGGRVRVNSPGAAVLWGAPRAFGVSVCKSKQAEKERSPRHPNLFLTWEILPSPSVSARTWEWSVRVECWLDSAIDVPPSPGDIYTLHFVECVCVCMCLFAGGSIASSLLFFLVKVECWGKLTLFLLS